MANYAVATSNSFIARAPSARDADYEFSTHEPCMNRFERQPSGAAEARVEYHDGDFRVTRPGAFVRCAVTGAPIPLDELRYWSVDRQEPYATPEAVLKRLGARG